MPELPEVETTVRGLRPPLEGKRLARVETRRADLRRPFPEDLRQRMTGATITGLGRRAKYGLIETDRGDVMVFHLGMSGRWRIDPTEIGTHDHLILETEEGRTLSLCDPRRFGSVDLVRQDSLADFPSFRALGPEPLGPDLTGAHLAGALKGRVAPIKSMLLDQRIVAGSTGWWLRFGMCWLRQSRQAARPCGTMPGRTANSAISRSNGASMAGKGRTAIVAP